jgi:hypothetical protein
MCIHIMDRSEGFVSNPAIRITACPKGSNTIITPEGDTVCCDGDSVDNRCNGTTICSLSPTDPDNGLLSCSEWVKREWQARGDRFCPDSMQNYFGIMTRKTGAAEGCSSSPCKEDGSLPIDSTQPTCKIYHTSDDEYANIDSCFNVRAKERMMVPMVGSTRAVIQTNQKTRDGRILPALLQTTYLPANGTSMTPVTCYDWDRFKIFLDAQDSTGQMSRARMVTKDKEYTVFCGASKAFYVDRTLKLESDPTPYENDRVYKVGDRVIYSGKLYRMVEAAGAPGYSPDRQGDRLWNLMGAAPTG